MGHVVYLDAQAQELDNLLGGSKTMLIRGAAGRKLPYGHVHTGDVLYFINNNGEKSIKAQGVVIQAFHSDRLTETGSRALIKENQPKLRLTEKQYNRWSGKRYLILVEAAQIEVVNPFEIDKSAYGNMDDWLPVDKIADVKKS